MTIFNFCPFNKMKINETRNIIEIEIGITTNNISFFFILYIYNMVYYIQV